MMKIMIDLFSGLGGASEAFIEDQEWFISRIENNPLLQGVKYTHNLDLSKDEDIMMLINAHKNHKNIDLIWASPPCLEFSNAYHAPKPRALREGKTFVPDLSLLKNTLKIIDELNPKYWVIENVAGASKIFTETIGMKPRQIISPYFLWGNFPHIVMPSDWKHYGKNNISGGTSDPLRSNKKAVVDIEVSKGLLRAINEQTQLTAWC